MEYIAMAGVSIIALISLYGTFKFLKFLFTNTGDTYEYVIVQDANGNYIEKVIDKSDKGDRKWEWESLS